MPFITQKSAYAWWDKIMRIFWSLCVSKWIYASIGELMRFSTDLCVVYSAYAFLLCSPDDSL